MGDDDRLDEVLAAWCERRDRGEHVDPEEIVRAHPELAEGLRARFAAMSALDEIFEESSLSDGAPEAIGEYRIVRELGTGGMGTVYLAEDAKGAPVALKVLHPHLLSRPGFFKRFLREADLGRAIEHENVVRTYDCDALLHDGVQRNYLVIEYVEGQTLRELLKELDRVPEELCRHIGREVAKGLAAIHEAGVLHRDLKPENVLITADHAVKVMDLGVARLKDEAIRLSQTGVFVGSLEYAAPEQFRGGGSEVDGRADLHALGLVLYELATGQHPYRTDGPHATVGQMLEMEARRAGDINPQLSPFFEEVVHTLIAKDREERFDAASELVCVLEEGETSDWWGARALALRQETKRPLRRIRIPRDTALYGRDDDLAHLHVLFERAKAGDGQVLLVEGEAGIGKTRLVDEFVGRLRQEGEDLNFVFGSYPPGGAATASGAFSEAFREQFGASGSAAYIEQTPVLVPAFDALLRGEPPPKGEEPLTQDSLQTVFVHATRSLAAERTTIVLIDDLHFAPEEGRALFSSLAMAVPGHRILLVGTMRPGVPEEWIANVTRLDQAEQRSLSRLGAKDLTRLLQDAFRSERLAEELGFKIAQKSDGNPYFVLEIIRGLREGQFITQQPDGTWITTEVIEDIQIPSSVLDLVNARVADLSEEERDLLDVAACCGFDFDPLLVGQVLGVGRIPALKRLAQIERRHRLVRARGGAYVFDHHQVQEALYGSLADPLRQAYHADIARTLETREGAAERDPSDLDGDLCVSLCDHYLEGAEGERAVRYLDAALDHLAEGYLNDPLTALADRALRVTDLLQGTDRLHILLRKNQHLDRLGRMQALEEVLAEVRTLAAEIEDKRTLAKVENAMAMLRMRTGPKEVALAHYEEMLAITREIGDWRGESTAETGVGNVLHDLGRYGEARKHHERSLAIAREFGDRRTEGFATNNLGNVFLVLGRYGEAREHHERRLAIAREIGDKQGEGSALGGLGSVSWVLGRYGEAREHHERSLAIAREIGNRRAEGAATGCLAAAFETLGHYEEAREHHERCRAIACEIGDGWWEAAALVNLGQLWLTFGDLRRARRDVEASLSLSRKRGDPYPEGYALMGLSALSDAEDDRVRALARAHDALTLRRDIGHVAGVVESLVILAQIHHRAGESSAARDALEEAVTLARAQQRWGVVTTALALLACLPGGDVETALSALEEAGESGDSLQVRFYLWGATHDRAHLAEAKRLLDYRVEHSPEEYRESMLRSVPLHRGIQEAWAEHGGGELEEAGPE